MMDQEYSDDISNIYMCTHITVKNYPNSKRNFALNTKLSSTFKPDEYVSIKSNGSPLT